MNCFLRRCDKPLLCFEFQSTTLELHRSDKYLHLHVRRQKAVDPNNDVYLRRSQVISQRYTLHLVRMISRLTLHIVGKEILTRLYCPPLK
jgi:hypothetical protein